MVLSHDHLQFPIQTGSIGVVFFMIVHIQNTVSMDMSVSGAAGHCHQGTFPLLRCSYVTIAFRHRYHHTPHTSIHHLRLQLVAFSVLQVQWTKVHDNRLVYFFNHLFAYLFIYLPFSLPTCLSVKQYLQKQSMLVMSK